MEIDDFYCKKFAFIAEKVPRNSCMRNFSTFILHCYSLVLELQLIISG